MKIEDEKSGGIVNSPQRANNKCWPKVHKAEKIIMKALVIYFCGENEQPGMEL